MISEKRADSSVQPSYKPEPDTQFDAQPKRLRRGPEGEAVATPDIDGVLRYVYEDGTNDPNSIVNTGNPHTVTSLDFVVRPKSSLAIIKERKREEMFRQILGEKMPVPEMVGHLGNLGYDLALVA